MTQLTALRQRCTFSEAEVFIDVYKTDDKIAISGAKSLAEIDLRRTYRAIDSVVTGSIPSLFCGNTKQLTSFNHSKYKNS